MKPTVMTKLLTGLCLGFSNRKYTFRHDFQGTIGLLWSYSLEIELTLPFFHYAIKILSLRLVSLRNFGNLIQTFLISIKTSLTEFLSYDDNKY